MAAVRNLNQRVYVTQLAPWLLLGCITALGAVLLFLRLNNLPPGQFLDEASGNLIARDTAAAGQYPVYLGESGGGYHPALIYLVRLARWLLGGQVRTGRYAVAASSVLSLPLVFLSLRAIFALDECPAQAAALALIGTFGTAIAVPYIIISRIGSEVSLPLPFTALTFLCLALGLRSGRRWHFALAGAALGLCLYTYHPARLVPVAVAAVMAWITLAEGRSHWRPRLVEFLIVAGVALVTALPLVLYFARHPDFFFARALSASGEIRRGELAQLPLVLLASTTRVLAGLVLPGYGDIRPRHNLPGRPLFDAFMAAMLGAGLVLALIRRRRSHVLLLGWAAVLISPAILTLENNSPHFIRLIAATPALAGLAALGVLTFYDVARAGQPLLAGGLVAVGLAFSLAATAQAVFVRWANSPELYEAFMVQDWTAASLAFERMKTQFVFLSPELIGDPFHGTFDLMLRGQPVRDFPGPGCLVYRDQPDRPETFITFLPRDRTTPETLARLFPAGQFAPPILRQPDLQPEFALFQVPAGAIASAPAQTTTAVFGQAVRLLGYDLDTPSVQRGGELRLRLYWRSLAAPLPDYIVFVHLYRPGSDIGAAGVPTQPVAQSDGAPCHQTFPTTRWANGEIVVDERTLTLPPDYGASSALIAAGMYGWPSLERLTVSGTDVTLSDNRVRLGEVEVVP